MTPRPRCGFDEFPAALAREALSLSEETFRALVLRRLAGDDGRAFGDHEAMAGTALAWRRWLHAGRRVLVLTPDVVFRLLDVPARLDEARAAPPAVVYVALVAPTTMDTMADYQVGHEGVVRLAASLAGGWVQVGPKLRVWSVCRLDEPGPDERTRAGDLLFTAGSDPPDCGQARVLVNAVLAAADPRVGRLEVTRAAESATSRRGRRDRGAPRSWATLHLDPDGLGTWRTVAVGASGAAPVARGPVGLHPVAAHRCTVWVRPEHVRPGDEAAGEDRDTVAPVARARGLVPVRRPRRAHVRGSADAVAVRGARVVTP